jgi:arylformamidase
MTWLELPQAERDRLYNNSAAVVNSAGIVAGWDASSARWREKHGNYIGLAYGTKPRQTWDIFPSASRESPCLIHIHGGYWQMRSKETFTFLAEGVAARGWSFALPGYTLAPENSVAGIVSELRTALDWFDNRRRSFGIGGPVILSGWSAGGHLTAMLLDHGMISGGLAISGIYELEPLRHTYLNEKLRLEEAQIEALSPMRLRPIPKPLAIAYGLAELPPLIENSVNFHVKRAEAKASGPLIAVEDANHFTILEHLRQPEGILAKATREIAIASNP